MQLERLSLSFCSMTRSSSDKRVGKRHISGPRQAMAWPETLKKDKNPAELRCADLIRGDKRTAWAHVPLQALQHSLQAQAPGHTRCESGFKILGQQHLLGQARLRFWTRGHKNILLDLLFFSGPPDQIARVGVYILGCPPAGCKTLSPQSFQLPLTSRCPLPSTETTDTSRRPHHLSQMRASEARRKKASPKAYSQPKLSRLFRAGSFGSFI